MVLGAPYHVTFRDVAFDDGQDVMQVDPSGLTLPQAHDVTQEKAIRVLPYQVLDLEGLELTPERNSEQTPDQPALGPPTLLKGPHDTFFTY